MLDLLLIILFWVFIGWWAIPLYLVIAFIFASFEKV